MPKCKPKFPPLAKGSKVELEHIRLGTTLASRECALAAAEWGDEAEGFRERKDEYGIRIYNDKLRLVKKVKFPPLAPGSKISFDYDYSYIGGVLCSLEIVACWAAAEWDDYAHAQHPCSKKFWHGHDMAIEWHDFRRERTKGGVR